MTPQVPAADEPATGQVWKCAITGEVWRIYGVLREHLIGDLFETTVTLVAASGGSDTLRIPASVLRRGYSPIPAVQPHDLTASQ